jgi:hypothetical protein
MSILTATQITAKFAVLQQQMEAQAGRLDAVEAAQRRALSREAQAGRREPEPKPDPEAARTASKKR